MPTNLRPREHSWTYRRTYFATVALHCNGVFPGPTAVNRRLHHTRRKMNMLNGVECRARAHALRDLGYSKHPQTGRWHR